MKTNDKEKSPRNGGSGEVKYKKKYKKLKHLYHKLLAEKIAIDSRLTKAGRELFVGCWINDNELTKDVVDKFEKEPTDSEVET